ncbi:MAG: release factor glutamine methyltransferase [Chthoniobacter sp.]|nr:release factor glutamine methyltransferase [Chthoniobacter sp.]
MTTKTVLDVLSATTEFFKKRGVESPRLNAEHLIAHVLRKKRIDLYMEFDHPLDETVLAPLRELVKRRAGGEPLQHLLGTVEFCGRIFQCDERALVPRPETERLVEMLIGKGGMFRRILDVGTGSGVIALSLAAHWPQATVDGVDLSPSALALAAQNAETLQLNDRVRFFPSDLFSQIEGRYDLIVANLPYIETEVLSTLAREVQRDPRIALDGGADGAEIIRRFAVEARGHLSPGGMIAMEIGDAHAEPLRAHLEALGFAQIDCKADYHGVNRFLFAIYG